MIFNPFWITLTDLLVMPGTSSTSPISAPALHIYIYMYIYIYIYIYVCVCMCVCVCVCVVKATWVLPNYAFCCFKQILEPAFTKTVAVWLLPSYHKNYWVWDLILISYKSRMRQCWPTSKTYIHQVCSDTRCRFQDLPVVGDDRKRWREKERKREGKYGWWSN